MENYAAAVKNCQVARRPSSSETSACQPSSRSASPGSSTERWRSPSRSGPCSGSISLPRGAAHRVDELEHRRRPAGRDVEDAAAERRRRQRRAGHVPDVDVVALLRAVAEDRRPPPVRDRAQEDRDDARLAVRVLPRPVDVAVAQRDVPRPVEPVPRGEVLLAGQLGRAVRRQRPPLPLLGRRRRALAVDRAAGRREHDLRAVRERGVEHGDRPEHVHLGVERRLRDRHAHGRLRGEVEDELGPRRVEDVARVADVRDVQPRSLGHVLAACPRRGRRGRAPRRRARPAPRPRASR